MKISIALSHVSDSGEDIGNTPDYLILDSRQLQLVLAALKAARESAQPYDFRALDIVTDAFAKAEF